jgi:predicted transcriptional regulator
LVEKDLSSLTSTGLISFEYKKIRRTYNEKSNEWFFSVIDVVGVLTDSNNASMYWRNRKIRAKIEDKIETSSN